MKFWRFLSAFCAVIVLCFCMVTPVGAAGDNDSAWIELLEYTTINSTERMCLRIYLPPH